VKYIPSWMPGFDFIRKAHEWRKDLDDLVQAPFDMVKADVARNEAPPSFVAEALQREEIKVLTLEEEDRIKWSALGIYTGGADSTIAGITALVLLMSRYPAAQRRAQQEIDDVTGGNRLPTFEDMPKLKYVTACVKEVLRYWPVLPLGLPHRLTTHEVYNGYDIPEGSTVIANIWRALGMMHDENAYSDPFAFKPERFLSHEDGGLEEPDSMPAVFGYGRRICPGMLLGEASLNIYAARLLSVLDISPTKDEKGGEIALAEDDFKGPGVITMPRRFPCSIKPRSPLAASLVMS
ncbi:cytochrome P450, partial [Vararia minispora EC-137]